MNENIKRIFNEILKVKPNEKFKFKNVIYFLDAELTVYMVDDKGFHHTPKYQYLLYKFLIYPELITNISKKSKKKIEIKNSPESNFKINNKLSKKGLPVIRPYTENSYNKSSKNGLPVIRPSEY